MASHNPSRIQEEFRSGGALVLQKSLLSLLDDKKQVCSNQEGNCL